MRRLILALLAALIPISQAAGATKYVSPDGAALWAACTTRDTPCALSTAQTSAAAGDVVVLLSGVYPSGLNTSTNGTSTNYITWLADVYRAAVLNGLASGQIDKTLVIDNNYHRFMGVRVNVQTGPGAANTYGVYTTGIAWQFLHGEITYTGTESVTGAGNVIYCAQLRSGGLFSGNYVHDCTYGVNVFSSSAGFAAAVSENRFADMVVGDYQDSDCMSVSGASSYDWTGLVFSRNECSGWRDDGADFSDQDNVTLSDNLFHTPAADPNDGNTSCIKIGYEGSNGTRALRNRCFKLRSGTQDNYGLILTGASDARVIANIVEGAFEGATIAERNGSGGDNNQLWNNVLLALRDDAIQVGTGATGTVFGNNILSGGTRDINVLTGISATGYANRRVNATGNGDGTYTPTGDTDGDPGWAGGPQPTTLEGFRPLSSSPLCGAGAANLAGAYADGQRFGPKPDVGPLACASPASYNQQ